MSLIVLYPSRIRLTGHPSQHGLADLALTFDTNDIADTHAIITTGQLVDLNEQITRKLAELPFHLVSEE